MKMKHASRARSGAYTVTIPPAPDFQKKIASPKFARAACAAPRPPRGARDK